MLTTFFERAKKVLRKKPAPELRKLVIAGRELQKEGILIPYFIIYSIKIPKAVVNQIFKQKS